MQTDALALLKKLAHHNSDVRWGILNDLEGGEKHLAATAARIAITDKHTLLRSDAATMLGVVGNASDFYRLKLATEDSDYIVRCDAIQSLTYICKKKAWPTVRRMLKEEKDEIPRSYAATVAYLTKAQGDTEELLDLMQRERSPRVIACYHFSLYALGYKDLWPTYVGLLDDEDEWIRHFAAQDIADLYDDLDADHAEVYLKKIRELATTDPSVLVQTTIRSQLEDLIKEDYIGPEPCDPAPNA